MDCFQKVIARLQQVIDHLQMTTDSTDPVVGNETSQSSVHEGTNSLEPGGRLHLSYWMLKLKLKPQVWFQC